MTKGLANSVFSLLKDKIPEEKTQTRIDKDPQPANVEGLRMPQVNPLIWNQLPAPVHAQDSKLQKKAECFSSFVGGDYKSNRPSVTTANGQNARQRAHHFSHRCPRHCNAMMTSKPLNLHKDYAALCGASTMPASSEYLFGEANKLTKKFCPPQRGTTRSRNSGSNGRHYHPNIQGTQSNRRFHRYQQPQNDILFKG